MSSLANMSSQEILTNNKNKRLLTTLRKKIISLSIPNILSNLTLPVAGLVDIALLGRYASTNELAGVALAGLIFDFVYLSFIFLRMGTTALTAQAYGNKNRKEVSYILFRMLIIGFVGGLLLLLLKEQIVNFFLFIFAAKSNVEDYAKIYFEQRILGSIALVLILCQLGWLLGKQKALTILFLTILLNFSNVILSFIFIYKLDMGAKGCGLATAISEWIACIVGFVIIFTQSKNLFLPKVKELFDKVSFKKIFDLGLAIIIRTLLLTSAYAIFANISATISTETLAANAILEHILLTCAYLSDGFAFSLEALSGKYYARKNKFMLRKSLYICLHYALIIALIISLLIFFTSDYLYGFLNKNSEIVFLMHKYELVFLPAIIIGTAAFIYDGYFIGLAKGNILMISMIQSFFIGFVPFALLALIMQNGYLLWLSLLSFMSIRTITLFFKAQKTIR